MTTAESALTPKQKYAFDLQGYIVLGVPPNSWTTSDVRIS